MSCPTGYLYLGLACFVMPGVGNPGSGGTKELKGLQNVIAEADSCADVLGVMKAMSEKQRAVWRAMVCGCWLCRSSSESGGCDGLREGGCVAVNHGKGWFRGGSWVGEQAHDPSVPWRSHVSKTFSHPPGSRSPCLFPPSFLSLLPTRDFIHLSLSRLSLSHFCFCLQHLMI